MGVLSISRCRRRREDRLDVAPALFGHEDVSGVDIAIFVSRMNKTPSLYKGYTETGDAA
jgi:hypothetical protein